MMEYVIFLIVFVALGESIVRIIFIIAANTIAELFSLPLRAEEEEQLFKFVQDFDRRLSNTGDLLLVYHLIRGRPIEAMCLLEKTKVTV